MTTLFTSCELSNTRKYLIDTSFNYKISPDCRVQIRIDWKDIDGKLILRERLIQLPKGETESFKKLNIPLVAPLNAHVARLSYIVMRQSLNDYIEITNFNFLKATE